MILILLPNLSCAEHVCGSVSMKKEARVMRDLRIVSYFRQCMPRDFDISSYKELVHSFATVHLYELHFSEIGVIGFHYQVCHKYNIIYHDKLFRNSICISFLTL